MQMKSELLTLILMKHFEKLLLQQIEGNIQATGTSTVCIYTDHPLI